MSNPNLELMVRAMDLIFEAIQSRCEYPRGCLCGDCVDRAYEYYRDRDEIVRLAEDQS